MLRLILFLFVFNCFFNNLNAQSAQSNRAITQELSQTEALLLQETKDVEGFERKLLALKIAFAEKDASRVVAYEAYLQGIMRNEVTQMEEKNTSHPSTDNQARMEKMTRILDAFNGHTFHAIAADAAARDFAQLDTFLQIMQAELADLKSAQK